MKLFDNIGRYTPKGQKIVESIDESVVEMFKKIKKKHHLSKEQILALALDTL